MCRVGISLVHIGKKYFLHFFPGLFGVGFKKINFNKFWVVLVPQAASPRKRRNTALYANACPGKRYRIAGIFY